MATVTIAAMASPAAAQEAGDGATDGLRVTSAATYTVDLPAGVVRTRFELTFLNTVPDRREGNTIYYHYFEGYLSAIQADATDVVVTSGNGEPIDFTLRPAPDSDGFFQILEITFPADLRSQQSLDAVVTYDLGGFPNRSAMPARVNEAYALFNVIALGDRGRSTVQVVAPTNTDLDLPFDRDVPHESVIDGDNTVLRFEDITPIEFSLFATAADETELAETTVVAGDTEIVFQAWPDDPEWIDFVHDRASRGIVELEDAIGIPFQTPGRRLVVRESAAPALEGYGGWFDPATNRIEVGEEFDPVLLLHELSHGWFNAEMTESRWITEGLAETYANQLAAEGDNEPVVAADGERFPLDEWTNLTTADQDLPAEEYGYDMSHYVVDALYDAAGPDGMRAVLQSLDDGRFAYMTDDQPGDLERRLTWMDFLDLMVDVGGAPDAEVTQLFQAHVVSPDAADRFDERAVGRATYDALVARGDSWGAPVGVRSALRRWDFDMAAAQMAAADGTLDARDELLAAAGAAGLSTPDFADGFEGARNGGDLDAVTASMTELQRRVAVIDEAETIAAAERTPFEQLALGDEDFADELTAARSAFADGDVATVDDVTAAIELRRRAADGEGRAIAADIADAALPLSTPATGYGLAAATVVALGVLAFVIRRRDRVAAIGGSGRVVADVDPRRDAAVDGDVELGVGTGVDLDEDALPRAGLSGMDRVPDPALGNDGEGARTAGVVQGHAALADVGDPVLELDEDIGAVVDAETVSGAEVLVDPDTHDDDSR